MLVDTIDERPTVVFRSVDMDGGCSEHADYLQLKEDNQRLKQKLHKLQGDYDELDRLLAERDAFISAAGNRMVDFASKPKDGEWKAKLEHYLLQVSNANLLLR